jgi:hypothetical protein
MAQRTIVQMTDDIDGSEATETVTFGLDGQQYEIDLNDAHAEDLREVLAPFISVARKAGGGSSRGRAASPVAPKQRGSSDIDAKAVRAWAEANGVKVSPRGRIGADVLEQYRAAQR